MPPKIPKTEEQRKEFGWWAISALQSYKYGWDEKTAREVYEAGWNARKGFEEERRGEMEENKAFQLIHVAKEAAQKARCYISNFRVGVALLAKSGVIYLGCNIEFDNFSNTIHAEETAIAAAVMAGETEFEAIAVATFDKQLWYPCGMCRQSLYEICGPDLTVIACNEEEFEQKTMAELLPVPFKRR